MSDQSLSILSSTVGEMSAEITGHLRDCMEKFGGDMDTNLDIVATRQGVIEKLDGISETINEIKEMLQLTTRRLRIAQDAEIQRINDVLHKLTGGAPSKTHDDRRSRHERIGTRQRADASIEHVDVAETTECKQTVVSTPRALSPTTPPPGWSSGGRPKRMIAAIPPIVGRVDTPPDMTRVKFTDACSLLAKPVDTFDAVSADGNLYWVKSACHFAFKIAGVLFHGGIGIIYTDDRTPCKLRECAYPKTCDRGDKCHYYHDPTVFQGSTDVRNYVSGSFLYTTGGTFRARGRSRQFGSIDRLDTDIVHVKPDEAARLRDQVMHDLLCALLVKDVVG